MPAWIDFCAKHWELAISSSGGIVTAVGFRQTLLNSKKTRREIERLERVRKEETSLIVRPSAADIEKYAMPFGNARRVVLTGLFVMAVGIVLQVALPGHRDVSSHTLAMNHAPELGESITLPTGPEILPPEVDLAPMGPPLTIGGDPHDVFDTPPAPSARAPSEATAARARVRRRPTTRGSLLKRAAALSPREREAVVTELGLPHGNTDGEQALRRAIQRADKNRLRVIEDAVRSVR